MEHELFMNITKKILTEARFKVVGEATIKHQHHNIQYSLNNTPT